MNRTVVTSEFKQLQDRICHTLEQLDGGKFQEDLWTRTEGGGGRTRIIEGNHIEKGGVNFSEVYGTVSPSMSKALQIEGDVFFATGVSIVLHAASPLVPIIHMNVRYFEMDEKIWWFGGGIDVTPHYINPVEAKYFHEQLKACCDQFSLEYYPRFKSWADDYFFLPHRNETRGIGGIFFDRLGLDNGSRTQVFKFVLAVGNLFTDCYRPLFQNNYQTSFSTQQKHWQKLRRGRYVEFNLVWDRGTKFGLHSNGRTESILMSLPKEAVWLYNYKPEKDSPEEKTLDLLKKDVNWIDY